MRAVNLIPSETRARARSLGPGTLVLAALAVAVALVTVYVLTSNTISDRQAQLSTLRAQVATEQAVASRLTAYERFESLAQARAQTVQQIVSSRFDWHAALSDLSKVVPANTQLQSLSATVTPASGSTSALRSSSSGPAFELAGCTHSQDDVARLMSRLRTMNEVDRVTLESSVGSAGGQSQASSSTSASSSSGATCTAGPSFHLLVFFQPQTSTSSATTSGSSSSGLVPKQTGSIGVTG